MASIDERVTAALEHLVALQVRQAASTITKEVAYIQEFGGEPHRLTHFFSTVETHLAKVPEERRQTVSEAILNIKIIGRAKELILSNAVTTWKDAKKLLTQHFRPIFNSKDIGRKITNLKVNSIAELNIKIEQILCDINSFILYEANSNELKNILCATLVAKIKDLVCGSLARDLRTEHNINTIKDILYTYVGFDENLEKGYNYYNKNHQPHPKHRPTENHLDRNRQTFYNNNSGKFRNHNTNISNRFQNQRAFNPSGQFRNSVQNSEPMDISAIELEETNNNIENQVFLN